jgi:hypothetical protein
VAVIRSVSAFLDPQSSASLRRTAPRGVTVFHVADVGEPVSRQRIAGIPYEGTSQILDRRVAPPALRLDEAEFEARQPARTVAFGRFPLTPPPPHRFDPRATLPLRLGGRTGHRVDVLSRDGGRLVPSRVALASSRRPGPEGASAWKAGFAVSVAHIRAAPVAQATAADRQTRSTPRAPVAGAAATPPSDAPSGGGLPSDAAVGGATTGAASAYSPPLPRLVGGLLGP